MENKHKVAGKEFMVIKNQQKNAVKAKQKGPKSNPRSKQKKSK